jgi:hypothetical protein
VLDCEPLHSVAEYKESQLAAFAALTLNNDTTFAA